MLTRSEDDVQLLHKKAEASWTVLKQLSEAIAIRLEAIAIRLNTEKGRLSAFASFGLRSWNRPGLLRPKAVLTGFRRSAKHFMKSCGVLIWSFSLPFFLLSLLYTFGLWTLFPLQLSFFPFSPPSKSWDRRGRHGETGRQ